MSELTWKVTGEDAIPLSLIREYDVNGDYQYYLSSGKMYPGQEYIPIADLDELPTLRP